MGFFGNMQKAMNGEPAGDVFEVAGITVTCSHCGGTHFQERDAQLNTAGMTFLDLDFLNTTARVLECTQCGHLEWFVS